MQRKEIQRAEEEGRKMKKKILTKGALANPRRLHLSIFLFLYIYKAASDRKGTVCQREMKTPAFTEVPISSEQTDSKQKKSKNDESIPCRIRKPSQINSATQWKTP